MKLVLALLLLAAVDCEVNEMVQTQTQFGRNYTVRDTGIGGLNQIQSVQLIRLDFGGAPQEMTVYLQGLQQTTQIGGLVVLEPARYTVTVGLGAAALYQSEVVGAAVGSAISMRGSSLQVDARIPGHGGTDQLRVGAFMGTGTPTPQYVPGAWIGNALPTINANFSTSGLFTNPNIVANRTWGWGLIGSGAVFAIPPFATRMRVLTRPRMAVAPAWLEPGYAVRAVDSLRIVELNAQGAPIAPGWGIQTKSTAPFTGSIVQGTNLAPWLTQYQGFDPAASFIGIWNVDGNDWTEALCTFEVVM